MDRYGLVVQPTLDVVGHGPRRGVAVGWLQRHRLEANRLQCGGHVGIDSAWWRKVPLANPRGGFQDVRIGEWRLTGEQTIKRRPKAVNVGGRSKFVDPPRCLLRAHVLRSANRRAHLGVTRAAGGGGAQGWLVGLGR